MNLSGFTFIHNAVEFDYCVEECVLSMLGCCDEVIAIEASSTDTTRERLNAIAERDPRLRIITAQWTPAPLSREHNIDWTRDLGEIGRLAALGRSILYLNADEVMHEKDYAEIRRMADGKTSWMLPRYNFWQDPQHLVPHGRVCGHILWRLAPRKCPVAWGCEALEPCRPMSPSEVGVYHYGFIRKPDGFRKKSEIMGQNFIGTIDPIIYEVEKEGIKAMRRCWSPAEDIPFTGTHPALMKPWLTARGYTV